jgi:hypothetical protein
MEDSKNTLTPPDILGGRKQPVILIAQLMRSITQMRHVDEVFVWLSNALVRYLDLPVVQFWTTEVGKTGQSQAELRALTTQNASLPQDMYLNNQVLAVVERLFHDKYSVMSFPIGDLFPPSQASLFAVYDLHYWAGYFLDSDSVFSSTDTAEVSAQKSIPLVVAVSLFTEAPLSADQMRAISFVLKQAMRIIINRRFRTFQNSLKTTKEHPGKSGSITLADIVPTRSQDLQLLQSINPFAHASIIAHKKARRLYSAVDGYRSGAELAQITHLTHNELIEALRYLFQQHKIEFYTLTGEHVEHLPLIVSAS